MPNSRHSEGTSSHGNSRMTGAGSRLPQARQTRLKEFNGFTELGMGREATALVRELLDSLGIKAAEFPQALSALRPQRGLRRRGAGDAARWVFPPFA